MPRLKSMGQIIRTTGIFLLGGTLLTLSACAPFDAPGSGGLMQRDVLEIKQKLDQSMEKQNADKRQTDYNINQILDELRTRSDATQQALDGIQGKMKEMSEELKKLRQVATMPAPAPSTAPTSPNMPNSPNMSMPKPPDLIRISGAEAYNAASQQFNSGNYPAARDAFRQLLATNPQGELKIETLHALAEACNALGEFDDANTYYEQVIRTKSDHPQAWASLERMAAIQIKKGNRTRALDMLKQIDQINPTYPNIARVRQTIGELQSGAGGAATPVTPGAAGQEPAARNVQPFPTTAQTNF